MLKNARKKILLFLVILTFLSLLGLMVIAQVSSTMNSLNQIVTKSGMRHEKTFPNTTLVVIMTDPRIYIPIVNSQYQVIYTLENCSLFETNKQGSIMSQKRIRNIHFFTAQHTSLAFFEAPKKAEIGFSLQFTCPPKSPQPLYQTGIVPKSLDKVLLDWENVNPQFDYSSGETSSSLGGAYEYVVNQIGTNPVYLEPSSMTFIAMARQEYYEEKHLKDTEFSLQTSAVEIRNTIVGYLVVFYEWQNDYVYTFESYQNKNYVSLVIVICTAVLAIERAIAFVNRVTQQSEEQRHGTCQQITPRKEIDELTVNLAVPPL